MTTREKVRAAVVRDLKPVRPLWSVGVRLLMLIPVAIWVALSGPLLGLREDISQLGAGLAWGLWTLQIALGVLVLGAALRMSVPGSGVTPDRIWALVMGATAMMLGITFATYVREPTVVPTDANVSFWYVCVREPMKLGLPVLLFPLVLVMRAFPTTPGRVGALCGFAAGILSDSGWRLACWVSSPSHILNSHFLAVLLLTLGGSGLALLIDYLRRVLLPNR